MNNEQLNTPEIVSTEDKTPHTSRAAVYKPKRIWSTDKLMAYIAFIISIGTFFTFSYQTYLIQKQQFRSVLPYLMVTYSTGFDNQGQRMNGLQFINNGVGPAIIEAVKIVYAGQQCKTVTNFFVKGIYADTKISTSRSELRAGYALPAGQILSPLSSIDAQAAAVLEKVFGSDSFAIEIIYSSLYEEKWKITYRKNNFNPKPVKVD